MNKMYQRPLCHLRHHYRELRHIKMAANNVCPTVSIEVTSCREHFNAVKNVGNIFIMMKDNAALMTLTYQVLVDVMSNIFRATVVNRLRGVQMDRP